MHPFARDKQDSERLKSVVSKICSTYLNVTHSIYTRVYKVYMIHFNIHFLLISEHEGFCAREGVTEEKDQASKLQG